MPIGKTCVKTHAIASQVEVYDLWRVHEKWTSRKCRYQYFIGLAEQKTTYAYLDTRTLKRLCLICLTYCPIYHILETVSLHTHLFPQGKLTFVRIPTKYRRIRNTPIDPVPKIFLPIRFANVVPKIAVKGQADIFSSPAIIWEQHQRTRLWIYIRTSCGDCLGFVDDEKVLPKVAGEFMCVKCH